jgi:hypothetical protein
MAQDNSKVNGIIEFLNATSGQGIAGSPTIDFLNKATPGQKKQSFTRNPLAEAAYKSGSDRIRTSAANYELANRINEGDTNLFGATLRILTGLGRGITNGAYDVMESANNAVEAARKGDVLGAAINTAATPFSFVGGALRGVAGSAPGTEGAIQELTGRPVIENWYELLKSPEFAESAANIPALKPLSSDEEIFGEGTWFTPSGIASTILDIGLDPASYATLGLGGALRGAGQGIRNVAKVREAAAEGTAKAGDFIPRNVYDRNIAKPEVGDAYNTLGKGPLKSTSFILKSAGSGFMDAHKRAIARIEARRTLKGNKAAMLSNLEDAAPVDLESANSFIDDMLELNIAKLKESATKTADEIAEDTKKLVEEANSVKEMLAKATADYPDIQVAVAAAREAAEEAAPRSVVSSPAIQAKLNAENTLVGVAKVAPLVERRRQMWLSNPAEISSLARDIETAVLNGEVLDVTSFEKRLSPEAWSVFKELIENPMGYRETKAKKLAKEGDETTLGVTATGRPITQGAIRTVQQAIAGTKLSRSVTEFVSSKEGMRVISLISGLGKKITGAGSKTTSGKSLISLREIEELFYTPQTLETIPASVLYARLAFLAERAGNTESAAYMAITRYADKGVNPLTAQGKHPVPSSFAVLETKSAKKPYTLVEVMEASRVLTGKHYSRELIETLEKAGATVVKLGDDGHPTLRTADELQEVLVSAMTKLAMKQAQAESRKIFNALKKQYPGLTEANMAQKLTPKELKVLEETTSRAIQIDEAKLNRLLAELNPEEDIIGQANKTLDDLGIEPLGRGSAFRVLAEGRMAFRNVKGTQGADLSDLKRALKNIKIFGDKPRDMTAAQAFGRLYTEFDRLATVGARDEISRATAQEVADLLKPLATSDLMQTPADVRKTLAAAGEIIARGSARSTNATNNFLSMFTNTQGKVVNDWVIRAGMDSYKASLKAGSRDLGVFASIVDKRVGEVIRKNKAEVLQIKKGSKEYNKLVELTFRDWYGPGLIWDGAGLSNWTVMDVIRNTGKSNLKALPQKDRELLEQNIAGMIERVKDRSWNFALQEEKFVYPAEFDKAAFARAISEGKPVDGIKISTAEQDALVEAATKFQYGLAGEAGDAIKALLKVPTVAPALTKFLSKLKRDSKGAIAPLNQAQRKELMAILDIKSPEISPYRAAISRSFVNQFANKAKKFIEDMRKEELIGKNLPDFISPAALKEAISKSGAAATTQIMMRMFLAENIITADLAVKATDRAIARSRGTTLDLVKERKSFDAMLTKFEATATRATKKAKVSPKDPEVAEANIGDFASNGKYADNPLMLIAKIRSFVLDGTADNLTEWKKYLDFLLESNIPKGEYKSFKEVTAEALRTPEGAGALRKLAELLADAGDKRILKSLDRGSKPSLATVQAGLDKVRAGASLNPVELDNFVKGTSLASELNMAAADEVEELAASLMPDQMLAEDYTAYIEATLRQYANSGQYYIPDLATMWESAIAERHIMWRAESVRFIRRNLDNVILDTNLPKGQMAIKDPKNEFLMMRTVEPQAVLTGSKMVYKKLSDLAEVVVPRSKFPEGEAGDLAHKQARAQWMRVNFEHIETLGELQLKRLGMHFAFTLKEGTGEAGILKLYGAESLKQLKETRPAAVATVYLSIGDVKNALPEKLVEDAFYMGPLESIPETAVTGAVRLAVALRSELQAGKEFTEEINNGLKQIMFDLIRTEIKTNTSLGKKVNGANNVYDLNKDLMDKKIGDFVEALTQPKTLDELVVDHIQNSAATMKMTRHQLDYKLGGVIEKLQQTLKNPAIGAGNRIEQMTKAFNEFEKIYKNRTYSDVVRNVARHDFHMFMVANMTKDDMNTFLASLYKEEEILTGEAAEIAKITGTVQTALKIEADSFEQALLNADGMNLIKAAENGTLSDELVEELEMNRAVSIGQAMHTRKYGFINVANATMERLFFGYGADYIMPLVNPLQRVFQEQVTTKTEHLTLLAEQLDGIGANRAVRGKAFKLIQEAAKVDEELLALASAHHIRTQTALAGGEALTLEEARITADVMEKLRPIFEEAGESINNVPLMEAFTRISQHVNEIFGGGKHSLVVSAGLNPNYLNEMISQVGGSSVAMFKGNDLDSIVKSWKEWPLDDIDPLETVRLLHAGLKHAQIIPMSAMTITKQIGVPKSAYKSLAEAKADGLDILPMAKYPQAGQRLIHFIDTENYYYPAHLIPEIKTSAKIIDQETRLAADAQFLQSLDRVQNRAKQFMTTLRPGNWVQNGIGGITVNAFKGLWNPLRYGQATRMIANNVVGGVPFGKAANAVALKNSGLDVTAADEWGARYIKSMADQGYSVKPASQPGSGTAEVLIGNRRVAYDEKDLIAIYRRQGGFVTSTAVFDPIDETMRAGQALRSGAFQKFTTKVGRWSANRDDVLRMSLYLELMKKQGGKNLEEASRTALREVNRVHPQMQDLSKFNQKWSKRTIMFFTWRAKTLGFLITEMLDQPGAILAFQKAYTNTMLSQGLDVQIGDLEPKNVPMRNYMEGNMNVLLPGAGGENLFSMSFANPVNDLFGSSGWLSGISLNSYEPVQDQVLSWGSDTFKNVFTASDPLIIGLIADWGFNQKTGQGTQFADSPDKVPLLVEDAFSRMGLKPAHTLLAYFMPDVFKRVSWEGKRMDKVEEEAYLEFINWVSGLRIRQVDKPEDRKKAVQELLSKISQYKSIELEQERKNLGG